MNYDHNLKNIIDKIHSTEMYCKLELRPVKYMFGTNNYGEIIDTYNPADGDAWDVIVPGYPNLQLNTEIKIRKLEGLIKMPNGNHKLIIDVFTDEIRSHKKNINVEIYTYRRLYNHVCKKRGEVYFF